MALYRVVWELISTGDLVAAGQCENRTPQLGYDTRGGSYSSSERGQLALDSFTFPLVTHIFRPRRDVPAGTDIFLQGTNIKTLHPGIRETVEQALDCFQRGLDMPATAMVLLKSADRTIADVNNAEVWTTALRERRNALHWDKAKSFVVDHSETGTLLMAAPQHLGTLEAIRDVR